MTTIKYYQNVRNANKFLEVHNDGHYHNSTRQFMYWTIDTPHKTFSRILNYTGDGVLHRWKKENLKVLLSDYAEVLKPF